jgi:carboxymethylenebutenolidase
MGETIEFASNGATVEGYLASPENGGGPAVVIIQEWWGLVPHIEEVCDRFAAEGFFALAPDLYHGDKASNEEPDEAGKLMMGLRLEEARRDMSGAVDALIDRSGAERVGVVGFCMGGGLALLLATDRPDSVAACVPFYGAIPWEDVKPDWPALGAAVQVHVGDKDAWAMGFAESLAPELIELGKDTETHVYEGADHAFFNDTRPEVYDEAASTLAFERTLAFLHSHLD